MASKTQLFHLKIWIEEILSLSKARGVITENMTLLKYQKRAITAALNGKDALILLFTVLEKLWIYQVLPFVVSRNALPIIKFFSRLGIWNYKPVWSADKFVWKLMLLRKSESYLEKKKFHGRIFFQSSQNVVRKKKVYMTK